MTTGTEGNDSLTNDRLVLQEVVDALGGDDLITVLEPDSATNPMNSESVTVNGGAGFDTLILNIGRRTLSAQGNGFDGSLFVRVGLGNSYPINWTSIERLEITTGLNSSIFNTGDSVDILRFGFGLGGTVNSGAGNDEIYFSEQPGGGAAVTARGGTGNDIIDYSATTGAVSGGYRAFGDDGDDRLTGSAYTDQLDGGAGNDVLRLDNGGDDVALGGAGADLIFFIDSLTATDIVTGGADVDTVIVQGDYAGGLTLSANVTEIEALTILGGNNTSFGEPGTNRYDYVLTTNNANFAAGVQAKINGAALLAGEDFTFNGSAETDASFVVYGGKGVDTLTGGFGNDVFIYAEDRFAPGDTVNGGPGGYDGIFLRGNYTIDFNAPAISG
jgi:Ca2+-binding RTX toxin-like protein